MSTILYIDCSTNEASVAIAREEELLGMKRCMEQKEHASFLQPAIQELSHETGVALTSLSAIAVTIGPGSYTGLRVGLASAKGLCYALQLPLITLGTLEVMAYASKQEATVEDPYFICPMIDARRQEVFTAVYDHHLKEVLAPQAMILDDQSYSSYMQEAQVLFSGNGSQKWSAICHHPNASFQQTSWDATSMIPLANVRWKEKQFASLHYTSPLYIKEFHDTAKQS